VVLSQLSDSWKQHNITLENYIISAIPILAKVGITDYNFPRGGTMPDYKKMYLTMFKASEDAVNLLLQAQRECEEIYISSPETDIKVLDLDPPCGGIAGGAPSSPPRA